MPNAARRGSKWRLRLADIGESGLLERVSRWIDPVSAAFTGMGDDAALIPPDRRKMLLTTDVLVEGTHFHRRWITPEEAGWKAIAANVSDAAAMGGTASAALLSLVLPPRLPVEAVRRLYLGFRRAARAEHVALLGGNLARGEAISITVFLMGRVAGRPFFRSGARPGDRVYVTGEPGLAALGLDLVRRYARNGPDLWSGGEPAWRRRLGMAAPAARRAARRFLAPRARSGHVAAFRRLSPTALLDVSDGLAADLEHLAEASRVRLEIQAASLPVSSGLRRLAEALGRDPVAAVFQGGEDYELLFTLPRKVAERVGERASLDGLPVTCIGDVVRGRPGVLLAGAPRQATRAFEHFASGRRRS